MQSNGDGEVKWLTSAQVHEAISACEDSNQQWLEVNNAILVNVLDVRATGFTYPQKVGPSMSAKGGPVSPKLWRRLTSLNPSFGWLITPPFELGTSGKDKSVIVIGLRFNAQHLAKVISTDLTSSPAKPLSDKGGANSGEHGEPIAALTLELNGRDESKVRDMTGVELGRELSQKYIALKLTPPCDRNAQKMANGILRAWRKRAD